MDEALVLCRCAHYGAAMLIFGASLFRCVLASDDLGDALDHARGAMPSMASLIRWSTLVAVATTLAWLILSAGEMGDGWGDAINPRIWAYVLFETAFGRAWQLHLLLGTLLWVLPAVGTARMRPAMTAILGGLFLASLGLIGHAVMLAGPLGWISRASQGLHLLAAGFWLGALVPLVRCLEWLDDPELRASTLIALRRFSGLGHGAVTVVLLTGVVNAALIMGLWPLDLHSPYTTLLLAKMGVVTLMVGIALFNRYQLVPQLKTRADALRRLRRLTIAEIGLGAVVIALVSLFGTLMPP